MRIFDQLLTILTPYECLGCAAEGDLLCSDCIQQLPPLSERCYRCLKPSVGGLTCSLCAIASPLYRVRASTAYTGAAKQIISRLKFSGAQAAAGRIALCMRPFANSDCLIMPVPTASSRVRSRGYDQAKLLARALSRQSRLRYVEGLARSGQTHQVGASRAQRKQQLQNAFRVRVPVRGQNILLIDDVVTTGATLEAAAHVLRAAGAKQIEAAVFCAA